MEARPAETTFEDVLDEYRAYDRRLDRIAAPLRLANAELCEQTRRDPGFTLHRLSDYPPGLQVVAEVLLDLSPDGLHIRSVQRGSAADRARLQAGDRIVSVNGQPISRDPSMSRYNQAVLDNGFREQVAQVEVETVAGRTFTARVRPKTACDIPTRVIFSTDINGHTNGRDVVITSELMRQVADDTTLALVVAHEMAHVIAGHDGARQSQSLELEADRMALVLMARAGFDIDGAVETWQGADHPHEGGERTESSHPTTQARFENFARELARIKRAGPVGELGFN